MDERSCCLCFCHDPEFDGQELDDNIELCVGFLKNTGTHFLGRMKVLIKKQNYTTKKFYRVMITLTESDTHEFD